MTTDELLNILDANTHNMTGFAPEKLYTVVASDLMSDVLTLEEEPDVLVTGLCNTQVIRTAEMADIPLVIIAKGKRVSEELIELAKEGEISLISTDLSVYKCCGLLYSKGLKDVI